MLDFGQFDFGQLAEIELAEVEIGRSRNWPKSKLAEVEIGRSRNWPKSNRWCFALLFLLSLFLFFSFACFSLFFPFFLFLLISLFILFLCCFCFRPQKPELNPKPRTLHPISDGPFRWTLRWTTLHWTTLRRTTLRRTPLRRTPLRRTAQNFALSFPSPATVFILSSLGGRFVEFWGFGLSCHQTGPPGLAHDSPRTPNVHISGPRRFKHHQNSTQGPQERERRKKIVAEEGKKSAKFWAPHPSGPHLPGPHLLGPTLRGPTFSRFGASTIWAPTLQDSTLLGPTLRGPLFLGLGLHPLGPTLRGPTLWRPKIQHPKIGRNRNWPKSKLAEVEIGRSLDVSGDLHEHEQWRLTSIREAVGGQCIRGCPERMINRARHH